MDGKCLSTKVDKRRKENDQIRGMKLLTQEIRNSHV